MRKITGLLENFQFEIFLKSHNRKARAENWFSFRCVCVVLAGVCWMEIKSCIRLWSNLLKRLLCAVGIQWGKLWNKQLQRIMLWIIDTAERETWTHCVCLARTSFLSNWKQKQQQQQQKTLPLFKGSSIHNECRNFNLNILGTSLSRLLVVDDDDNEWHGWCPNGSFKSYETLW